jgi:hypothetical protein
VVEVRFNLTRADGKKLGGWMRDISDIVADTLSPGEQVTVEFQLPGQATPIKLNCTIRYSVGTRFGLEFTALNSQHRAAILEACDQLQLAD